MGIGKYDKDEIETIQEMIDKDRIDELNREYLEGEQDSWIRENIATLQEEYLEMYKKEFKAYCEEQYRQQRG